MSRSIHCILSGVPLRYKDPVVAIQLQRTTYKNEYSPQWLPASLPVHGTFSDDGIALDDGEFIGYAHESLWNELHSWWDKHDNGISLKDIFIDARTKYLNEVGLCESMAKGEPENYWKSKLDNKLQMMDRVMMSGMSRFHSLHDSILAEAGRNINDGTYGLFGTLVYNLIINESWTDQICFDLETLATIYVTTIYTGMPILPSSARYSMQGTDFKKELKWHKLVYEKAREQRKKEVIREKEYKKWSKQVAEDAKEKKEKDTNDYII